MSTGLNPSGLGRAETFGPTKHESVSTESLVTTFSFRMQAATRFSFTDQPRDLGLNPGLTSQILNVESGPVASHATISGRGGGDSHVWQLLPNGDWYKVIEVGSSSISIQKAAQTAQGAWVILETSGTPFDLELYDTTTDVIEGVTATATQSDVESPLLNGWAPYCNGSEHGVLVGEYNSDAGKNRIRIFKVDANAGSITTVQDNSDHRHCHALQQDPQNHGTFYAMFGDADDEVGWYQSTDFGDTWSLLSDTTGAQTYRTLNATFTEDYIYWGMDGWDSNDEAKAYRVQRGSWDSPEELFTTGSKPILCFGATLVEEPHGVLFNTRLDDPPNTEDTVPLWFYSIPDGKARKLHEFDVDAASDDRAGLTSVLPYQSAGDSFAMRATARSLANVNNGAICTVGIGVEDLQ